MTCVLRDELLPDISNVELLSGRMLDLPERETEALLIEADEDVRDTLRDGAEVVAFFGADWTGRSA